MTDISKKAKKFASDSAKAKGNCNFVIFFLWEVWGEDIYLICNGGKRAKYMKNCGEKNHIRFSAKCLIIFDFDFSHKFLFWCITNLY